MFAKKQDNFFSFLLPAYFFAKFFGIFLPSFKGDHRDGTFHITIFDKIWTVMIYCVMIIFTILCNLVNGLFDFLMSRAWEFCSKLGLFVALAVLIYCNLKHSKIIDILTEFKKFDEKVKFVIKINILIVF